MPCRLPALALTAILATTGAPSLAQDAGGFVVRGMGALSCDQLVSTLQSEQSEDAAVQLVAWLSGYVSHANRADAEINDVLPYANVNGLGTVVARICANSPNAQVEAVTASALATLAPLAVSEPEDAVELRRGEAAVLMRPSVLQGIQERLIARELLPEGSADGVYGEQTATALASFQETAGIDPTGLPDAWTVFVLQVAD